LRRFVDALHNDAVLLCIYILFVVLLGNIVTIEVAKSARKMEKKGGKGRVESPVCYVSIMCLPALLKVEHSHVVLELDAGL